VNAGPHILLATDRNLYAMTLSGARLLDVGDVVIKVPLDQAELRRDERQLILGGITFHVMALFGEHAESLCEFVDRSRASSAAEHGAPHRAT